MIHIDFMDDLTKSIKLRKDLIYILKQQQALKIYLVEGHKLDWYIIKTYLHF